MVVRGPSQLGSLDRHLVSADGRWGAMLAYADEIRFGPPHFRLWITDEPHHRAWWWLGSRSSFGEHCRFSATRVSWWPSAGTRSCPRSRTSRSSRSSSTAGSCDRWVLEPGPSRTSRRASRRFATTSSEPATLIPSRTGLPMRGAEDDVTVPLLDERATRAACGNVLTSCQDVAR
jgi:hypothetical protein